MALNNFKLNHLMSLHFKGLKYFQHLQCTLLTASSHQSTEQSALQSLVLCDWRGHSVWWPSRDSELKWITGTIHSNLNITSVTYRLNCSPTVSLLPLLGWMSLWCLRTQLAREKLEFLHCWLLLANHSLLTKISWKVYNYRLEKHLYTAPIVPFHFFRDISNS